MGCVLKCECDVTTLDHPMFEVIALCYQNSELSDLLIKFFSHVVLLRGVAGVELGATPAEFCSVIRGNYLTDKLIIAHLQVVSIEFIKS